jgi:phospholipid/cholesterol/gamma-HCH transport system substrate-binding protein
LESKANYTVVGLFVLILTAGIISTSLWLSMGFNKKDYDIYVVYMHEAVSGLTDESPVKFNGVKVGYVKDIQLNPENPQQVELLLNIEHGTPITTSTSATLISQGITGTTYVGLAASSANLTPLLAKKGQPYPIIPSKASLFNQLDNALKGVSENINAVTIEIKRLFNEENTTNLKDTLFHLKNFTKTLDEASPETRIFIKNMSIASEQFPTISTEFNSGLMQLKQYTIPSINTLINRLNNVANNLEKASRDIRSNPSVLIRGTAVPKPGPGE